MIFTALTYAEATILVQELRAIFPEYVIMISRPLFNGDRFTIVVS